MQVQINRDQAVTNNFKAVPADTYKVRVAKIEDKVNGNGKEYVNFTLEVLEGEYADKKIFHSLYSGDYFNQMLISILDAIGISSIGDTKELEGKVMSVKTEVEEYTWEGEDREKAVINPFKGFIKSAVQDVKAEEITEPKEAGDDVDF